MTSPTTETTELNGHRIRHTLLADGRDMIYVDDCDTHQLEAPPPDRRPRFDRNWAPQMRFDPLMGEWISVAAQRNQRAHLPAADQCPLCPQTDSNLSEIPAPFDVCVFENRNPSFGATHSSTAIDPDTNSLFRRESVAVGRCEVVVFSPDHDGSFARQTTERLHTVYTAWQHRTEALLAMPGVTTVFPFENRGQDIGVTLHHPHGQIYGYPYVTPTLEKIIHSSEQFGPGFFDEFIRSEQSSSRVVYRGEHLSAFVPFAARWPLEVMVFPHRDVGVLTDLTAEEIDEAVSVHQRILRSFDTLYNSETPYISGWYQAPRGVPGSVMRLHLKMFSPRRSADKLKYLAGSESAMGAFISDVTPETQADTLRDAMS